MWARQGANPILRHIQHSAALTLPALCPHTSLRLQIRWFALHCATNTVIAASSVPDVVLLATAPLCARWQPLSCYALLPFLCLNGITHTAFALQRLADDFLAALLSLLLPAPPPPHRLSQSQRRCDSPRCFWRWLRHAEFFLPFWPHGQCASVFHHRFVHSPPHSIPFTPSHLRPIAIITRL